MRLAGRIRSWTLPLPIVALSLASALAQPQGAAYVRENYDRFDYQIPMRDGVRLYTVVYAPKGKSARYPFLMMRTPYSVRPYEKDQMRGSLGPTSGYAEEKFIFVYQDVRGRYMSEGDFEWMRPYKPTKSGLDTDESTDTWDTIEFLLKTVPNHNGRVGVYGTSYPGHYAAQTLTHPHPALRAVSPQAPMADNWLGDDMHHNGAFFLPHAMNFIAGFGKKREGPTTDYGRGVFQHGTPDGYRFFLEMGALPNANRLYLKDQIRIWNEWMEHGDYDAYWQAQNVPQHLKQVGKVAVLTVGGWWDAEDLFGPLAVYKSIESNNPGATNHLVMGPWYHGSWNFGPGNNLHDIVWTTNTGEDFREKMQMPFFRHFLKDAGPFELSDAMMFDVGADKWFEFDSWPPKAALSKSLYLRAGELLSLTPPAASTRNLFAEYMSDPNRPVPCSAEISVGMPRSYMIEDQRFVWNRPDVLSFETPVLEEDITLAGPLTATLFISTTGTDADFIVKLIDVYPNDAPNNSPRTSVRMGGYQMLIRGEPMRAKYRTSWSNPTPLTPNRVEKVSFVLPDVLHTFRKGHKIMVQVHSSWFPLIDRNPHRFLNIYQAKDSDFQKATHKVHFDAANPSHLAVGVLPSGAPKR
ncbi:MAG: CocE/NonD family hydrolase [Fimbriimonadaceae bacterium]|nr:CocE/NonD family hydrolase [Fimbriimonadaceae bacterium]